MDVADSQLVDRIDIVLPRGGVMTGRATDELGEPCAGVIVQAARPATVVVFADDGALELQPTALPRLARLGYTGGLPKCRTS